MGLRLRAISSFGILLLATVFVSCPGMSAKYSVVYNGNGQMSGSAPVDSAAYAANETVTVLGNTGGLTKTGYTFDGWSGSDAGALAYAPGQSFAMASANVSLYAHWEKYQIDHTNYDPSSLSDAEIGAAAALKVYFEHASVGQIIFDDNPNNPFYTYSGMTLLKNSTSRYSCGRTTWTSTWPSDGTVASWYDTHTGLGDNFRGNPGAAAKVSDFQTSMSALGSKVDVAMFKFCYIDYPADAAAANALFNNVKSAMEGLESSYPAVAFVWWTMPITSAAYTGDGANWTTRAAARQSYNTLVRSYCQVNNKWLFDLADLESHDDSGTAVTMSGYEAMYSGYDRDGGHINDTPGGLKMAKAYWKLIAEIARTR